MELCFDCGCKLASWETKLWFGKPICDCCEWWRMGGPIDDPLCITEPHKHKREVLDGPQDKSEL